MKNSNVLASLCSWAGWLSLAWSQTPKKGFLASRPNLFEKCMAKTNNMKHVPISACKIIKSDKGFDCPPYLVIWFLQSDFEYSGQTGQVHMLNWTFVGCTCYVVSFVMYWLKKKKKWAMTLDFQQCGMWDQRRLRPACAYAQSDQSLC